MVESYSADARSHIADVALRIRRAAAEQRAQGAEIGYRGSIAIPIDEVCFHLFDAVDAAMVKEVCARAGISSDRIAEAIAGAGDPTPG